MPFTRDCSAQISPLWYIVFELQDRRLALHYGKARNGRHPCLKSVRPQVTFTGARAQAPTRPVLVAASGSIRPINLPGIRRLIDLQTPGLCLETARAYVFLPSTAPEPGASLAKSAFSGSRKKLPANTAPTPWLEAFHGVKPSGDLFDPRGPRRVITWRFADVNDVGLRINVRCARG